MMYNIKSADTGKYNLIYANSLLTYIPCDVIVHMVVLRKLAMPAADGVFYYFLLESLLF